MDKNKIGLPLNHTLRYLYSNNIEPTVANYLALDYMGDISSLDGLADMPEDYVEVKTLVENGFLVTSEQVN